MSDSHRRPQTAAFELPEGSAAELAKRRFRHMFAHIPTGVTIITAQTPNGPTGMTANSFGSVSLDPPLVLFCPAKTSETWPKLRAARLFCVNILAGHQQNLCEQFAMTGAERFLDVPFRDRPGGPALDDAVGWVDCELETEHEAGDHFVVLARVLDLDMSSDVAPLVFHLGQFRPL